ncbi:MAG: hypothetical protein U0795_15515 [Pirellulales bacterium]
MSPETSFVQNAQVAPQPEDERSTFEAADAAGQPSNAPRRLVSLCVGELVLGQAALTAWFLLFAGGMLINTRPYQQNLDGDAGVPATIQAWVVVCSFWTMTNVGLLSCVTSIIGGLGQRLHFATRMPSQDFATEFVKPKDLVVFYASALMRGFVVYTLAISGLLVFSADSWKSIDQASYIRLAALASVIGLYGGYDVEFFDGMFRRIKGALPVEKLSSPHKPYRVEDVKEWVGDPRRPR